MTTLCQSNAFRYLDTAMLYTDLVCQGVDHVSREAFRRDRDEWCTDERRWCNARRGRPVGLPLATVLAPSPTHPAYVRIDPVDGRQLGLASEAERAAYLAQPGAPAFRKAVRVGGVLVDEDTGPGMPAWSQGCD